MNLSHLTVITFTHKNISLIELGKLVVSPDNQVERLKAVIGNQSNIEEIFFLATCNRVAFVLVTKQTLATIDCSNLLRSFYSNIEDPNLKEILAKAQIFQEKEAVTHLLNVASSIDSMVVGEREISRQLRQAYEQCRDWGFTGDYLRLLMRVTVKAAKEVFTETRIAEKPISVASLAVRKLIETGIGKQAHFVIIGAGETNGLVTKYLYKQGFRNFTVFNRTLSKAQLLAKELNGNFLPLTELPNFNQKFDAIITCTSATEPIVDTQLWSKLKSFASPICHIVDLALPNDVSEDVIAQLGIKYISISDLKKEVTTNLAFRAHEMHHANQIIQRNLLAFLEMMRIRNVELAMSDFPKQIKAIREKTVAEVFSKEYALLDSQTKLLVDKMLGYMEKKCISIPMKIAREKLLDSPVEA